MASFNWMMSAESWMTLLGESSLRAAFVLGGAWLACFALRRGPAAARHLIWGLSLAALVAAPAVLEFAPKLRVPAWWRAAATPSTVDVSRQSFPAVSAAGSIVVEDAADSAVAEPEPLTFAVARPVPAVRPSSTQDGVSLPGVLLFAWAAGLAVFLTRLTAGHMRVRKMARGATPMPADDAAGALLQAGRPVTFLRSRTESMPMTWGWRKPVVLLPASFSRWDAPRRAMTIHHELAHIRRSDWLTQSLAHAIAAVYWFHPLVWLALRRVRVEADRACDDMVLRAGVKASGYAGHLVRSAREFRNEGLRPWVAIAMAHPSSLNQRVQYVLDGKVQRAGLGRRSGLALALSVALIVVAVPSLEAVGQTEAAAQLTVQTAGNGPANASSALAAVSEDTVREVEENAGERILLAQETGPWRQSPDVLGAEPQLRNADRAAEAETSSDFVENEEELERLQNDLEYLQGQLSVSAEEREAMLRQLALQAVAQRTSDAAEQEAMMRHLAQQANEQRLRDGRVDQLYAQNQDLQEKAAALRDKVMAQRQPSLSSESMQTASEALRKALSSSDAGVRAEAAESLGRLGSAEAATLEALGSAVSDPEVSVQKNAVEALGRLLRLANDMPGDRAVAYLAPALQSPDADVRREAAEALRRLRGPAAIEAAVQLMSDANPAVQREAIQSLGRLLRSSEAETARAALPALRTALDHEDPDVRRELVETLGRLRSIADEVVPLLAKAAEDPDPGVQREAVEALGRISRRGFADWGDHLIDEDRVEDFQHRFGEI